MSASSRVKLPSRLSPAAQAALLVGPLLTMIDSSVVNVALPDIAAETGTTLANTQAVVSYYLLALGVGLCLTPYLSKRWGTQRAYFLAMAGFIIASTGCTLAPTLAWLAFGRVVQGFSGAPLVPLAMSMLFHGDSRSRNGENVSAVAGFALFAAPAFGPVVGGAIIGVGGWRWIFLINLPIGVISLLLHRAIPRDFGRPADSKTSFDVPGFVALAAAMCAVLEAAQSGPRHGWMAKEAVIPMVLGVMLFIVYQRLKSPHHPAVDTSLIQRANTRLAVLLSAVASVATFAALVLIPTYAQEYQRYSPSATGWAMLPAGIITGLGSVLSRRIQGSIGMRATVAVGFVILSVATLTLTSVTRDTSLLTLAAILSGRAAAIGLITTPLLGLISSSVQADASADATTLFNIVQRVAASLGIAAIGTWYAHRAAAAGPQVALHECGIALSVLSGLALLATAFLHAAPVGSHEGDIQETKG